MTGESSESLRLKLPSPELAIIETSKLSGYCLNTEHSEGQHKARVFKSALGIDLENIQELRNALFQALLDYEATFSKSNQYGRKYVLDFPMIRESQEAMIRSVWIVRYNENFPRLVSCYVL